MHWPTWRDLPGAVIDLQRRRFRRLSRGCLARAGETPFATAAQDGGATQ
jgi:hypothetical protein